MFLAAFLAAWLVVVLGCRFAPDPVRKGLAGTILGAFSVSLALFANQLEPWQRLLATTVGMLWLIKAVVLLRMKQGDVRAFCWPGLLLYMSVWPGVDPYALRQRSDVSEDGSRFARGYGFAIAGALLAVALAAMANVISATVGGWLGLVALLLMVHFGYADMLTSAMRLLGWNVKPLFEEPLKSGTLRDFWSKRWNLAFVEMDKLLFLRPLTERFGASAAVFLVFVISGLLHDLCISYSAGGGWGLPTLYFILHASAVHLERRWSIDKAAAFLRTLWTWGWLLIPLPLLFTEQFRSAFILPLVGTLHGVLAAHDLQWYLGWCLWLAGIGHFCTLGAGLQVPLRLNWREELGRLSSFNRKIFLNYAAYVGMTIIAFGFLTLTLHDEIMRGDRTALFLSGFIALFWIVRLAVDAFWFGHQDWPKGPQFAIGHALLNTLFVFMAGTYTAVVLYHVFRL